MRFKKVYTAEEAASIILEDLPMGNVSDTETNI